MADSQERRISFNNFQAEGLGSVSEYTRYLASLTTDVVVQVDFGIIDTNPGSVDAFLASHPSSDLDDYTAQLAAYHNGKLREVA